MQRQADLEREMEESTIEIQDLQAENARLLVELDAMVQSHEDLKQGSFVAEEDMRETVIQLESQQDVVKDYSARLKSFEEQNQSLQQEIEELEHMLKIAMLREQELVKRDHALQKVITLRETEISDLKRQFSEATNTSGESIEKLSHIELLCRRMEENVSKCLSDVDTKETLVLSLQQDLQECQRQLGRTKADNKRHLEELKIRNERIEELEQNASINLIEQQDQLTGELIFKCSENSVLVEQNSILHKLLDERISQLEDMCADLEILPELGSMVGSFMRQQKIQVQRLEDELMLRHAQVADTSTKLQSAQEELKNVRGQAVQGEETIGLLKRQLREQQPIVQDLVKAMAVRDAEAKSLRSELLTKERELILTSAQNNAISSVAADLAIYSSTDGAHDFQHYRSISRASSRGSVLLMPPPENDIEQMERKMMGLETEDDLDPREPVVPRPPSRPDSALSQGSACSSGKIAKQHAETSLTALADVQRCVHARKRKVNCPVLS